MRMHEGAHAGLHSGMPAGVRVCVRACVRDCGRMGGLKTVSQEVGVACEKVNLDLLA